MTFVYITGIVLCIIATIIIIDKIQYMDTHQHVFDEKRKLIEDTNDKLDLLMENLGKPEKIITKVDNISKNIIKFRK